MKKRSRQVTSIICKNIYLQVESNVVNAVQFFEGKDISVKNIIRQKKYAGNDGYPVIVDAELFEKANSMLKFNIENDWKYGIKKKEKILSIKYSI